VLKRFSTSLSGFSKPANFVGFFLTCREQHHHVQLTHWYAFWFFYAAISSCSASIAGAKLITFALFKKARSEIVPTSLVLVLTIDYNRLLK